MASCVRNTCMKIVIKHGNSHQTAALTDLSRKVSSYLTKDMFCSTCGLCVCVCVCVCRWGINILAVSGLQIKISSQGVKLGKMSLAFLYIFLASYWPLMVQKIRMVRRTLIRTSHRVMYGPTVRQSGGTVALSSLPNSQTAWDGRGHFLSTMRKQDARQLIEVNMLKSQFDTVC